MRLLTAYLFAVALNTVALTGVGHLDLVAAAGISATVVTALVAAVRMGDHDRERGNLGDDPICPCPASPNFVTPTSSSPKPLTVP